MTWEVNDLAEVSRGIIFHSRLNGRKQNILSIVGLFLSHCNAHSTVGRTPMNACSTLPNKRYSSIQKQITTQSSKESKKGLIGNRRNASFFWYKYCQTILGLRFWFKYITLPSLAVTAYSKIIM